MNEFVAKSSNWMGLYPNNTPGKFSHRIKVPENIAVGVVSIKTTGEFFNIVKPEYITILKTKRIPDFQIVDRCKILPGYYPNACTIVDALNSSFGENRVHAVNEDRVVDGETISKIVIRLPTEGVYQYCIKIDSEDLLKLLHLETCNPLTQFGQTHITSSEFGHPGYPYDRVILYLEGIEYPLVGFRIDSAYHKIFNVPYYLIVPKSLYPMKEVKVYFKNEKGEIIGKRQGTVKIHFRYCNIPVRP